MLRLFIKDNTNGEIHEYGESCHDALILQEDGSLHYENMQNCTGTMFPEEGYSFCLADGTVPPFNDPEQEPYVDIGGEYYTEPQTNADRIRAMTDEELASHLYLFSGLEERIKFCKNLPECEVLLDTDGIPEGKCVGCLLDWLKQPAEETDNPK